eukprot:TRINITY_DN21036_c0_g1_i2.p1 TRINITY_DN21036_c0_g1~~TRINITY_DN21036_c0_g1_i2.p1  ORF type:complete len:1319 (+),score=145.82 TRINITY_DN21036_c0_g1_i2:43-3957(+)
MFRVLCILAWPRCSAAEDWWTPQIRQLSCHNLRHTTANWELVRSAIQQDLDFRRDSNDKRGVSDGGGSEDDEAAIATKPSSESVRQAFLRREVLLRRLPLMLENIMPATFNFEIYEKFARSFECLSGYLLTKVFVVMVTPSAGNMFGTVEWKTLEFDWEQFRKFGVFLMLLPLTEWGHTVFDALHSLSSMIWSLNTSRPGERDSCENLLTRLEDDSRSLVECARYCASAPCPSNQFFQHALQQSLVYAWRQEAFKNSADRALVFAFAALWGNHRVEDMIIMLKEAQESLRVLPLKEVLRTSGPLLALLRKGSPRQPQEPLDRPTCLAFRFCSASTDDGLTIPKTRCIQPSDIIATSLEDGIFRARWPPSSKLDHRPAARLVDISTRRSRCNGDASQASLSAVCTANLPSTSAQANWTDGGWELVTEVGFEGVFAEFVPEIFAVSHIAPRVVSQHSSDQAMYCSAGGSSGPGFLDAVLFAGAEFPPPPLTIVLRVRLAPVGTYQTLVGWGAGPSKLLGADLRLTPEGTLEYGELRPGGWHSVIADIDGSSAPRLVDGTWHDIAMVRRMSGKTLLYVDGHLAGMGHLPANSPLKLATGARSARLTHNHNDHVAIGDVTELRLFGVALDVAALASMWVNVATKVSVGASFNTRLRSTHSDDVDGLSAERTAGRFPSRGASMGTRGVVVKSDTITSSMMEPTIVSASAAGLVFCDAGGSSGPGFIDSVHFEGANLPSPPYTLTLKIRLALVGTYQTIVGWGAGHSRLRGVDFRLTPKGELQYGELGSTGWHKVTSISEDGAPFLGDGGWHRVAVARLADGKTFLYADGLLVGMGRLPAEVPDGLAPGARSARLTHGHRDFVALGDVVALRIYAAALDGFALASADSAIASTFSCDASSQDNVTGNRTVVGVDIPWDSIESDSSLSFLPQNISIWLAQSTHCSAGGSSGPGFADSVHFAGAALPPPPLTVSVRFRLTCAGAYQTLVGWGARASVLSGVELRVTPQGALQYGELGPNGWHSVVAASTATTLQLVDGAWHRVAVVRRKGGKVSLFADGRLVAQGALPGIFPEGLLNDARSARLTHGHHDYVALGDVTALRIFATALSDEVLASPHWNAAASIACMQTIDDGLAGGIDDSGRAVGGELADDSTAGNEVLPDMPFTTPSFPRQSPETLVKTRPSQLPSTLSPSSTAQGRLSATETNALLRDTPTSASVGSSGPNPQSEKTAKTHPPIYLLVLDGLSRADFLRYAPRTAALIAGRRFLPSLDPRLSSGTSETLSSHFAFDFPRFHAQSGRTLYNMGSFFFWKIS